MIEGEELREIEDAARPVIQKLVDAEHRGVRTNIALGPWSLWLLITALQATARHPALSESMQQHMTDLGHQLSQRYFTGEALRLINMGFDPDTDIPGRDSDG